MVYKAVPQRGTNIIQLLLNHVGDQQLRKILPGQDFFENIVAFNGKTSVQTLMQSRRQLIIQDLLRDV